MTTIPFIIPSVGAHPNAHENALLESKRSRQSTLDALSSHIAILDGHGTIIEVNAAWIRFACENGLIGGHHGVGVNYLNVCDSAADGSSEGAPAVAAGIRAVMARQRDEFNLEYPCHSPDERRWFIIRVTRFGGEGPLRVVVAHENITERKLAEETLRERDRLLSESQRLGHIGSWFYDMTGPISWSEEMYRIYGVSPDTFIPTVESLLCLIHPDDRPGMHAWLASCAAGEKSVEFEFRIIRPDGTLRFIKDNGEAVHVDNKLVHMAGTSQDITERKNAALQLAGHEERESCFRRALDHERELNLIKSRFVSLVSHEFRTPLCVIGIAGSLLGRYSDRMTAKEQSRQIEGIQSAVERMTRMMEDLLIHGEFEAGKMECKPARVDLEALCQRLIAEVPNQADATRTIECFIDPATREAVLDAKILRHILSNLLSNAVKYSSADQPIALEVTRVAGKTPTDVDMAKPEGDRLQLKVSDEGIGIPVADLARVFQTFQRASNVGNRPGTGMGLAIVKQFVDLHRGTIQIESLEGKGTTVWVWLPIVSPNMAQRD